MPYEDADVLRHESTVAVSWDSRGTVDCPTRRFPADVNGHGRSGADERGAEENSRKYGTSCETERRRSRTDRAVGYTTALVLKTNWATGPMPLRVQGYR